MNEPTKPTSEPLKACPFCGSDKLEDHIQYVVCASCDAMGPDWIADERSARDLWNTRPPAEPGSEALDKVLESSHAKRLTAQKMRGLLAQGFVIHGFTFEKDNQIGILDRSACRWLNEEEFWEIMHPGPSKEKAPCLDSVSRYNDSGMPDAELIAKIYDLTLDFKPDAESPCMGTIDERIEASCDLAKGKCLDSAAVDRAAERIDALAWPQYVSKEEVARIITEELGEGWG